jgi:hypothetical protein
MMAGRTQRRRTPDLLMLAIAMARIAVAAESPHQGATNAPIRAQTVQEIELRGKVVCLVEEMNRLHQTNVPAQHEHLYGFKSEDGKYYTLLRSKYSEALFSDKRLAEKDLLLKGRLFPNSQIFEPMRLRSVRNGVVHDLYYYCAICAIDAVAPGVCDCCQGPTELVERPLSDPAK